jgi:hypothetical protein
MRLFKRLRLEGTQWNCEVIDMPSFSKLIKLGELQSIT